MKRGVERRPFGELGDQQLLDQARRLAANKRCLDVHIMDHLAEIDRRGLALRRGYSSLFDYAVRELLFSPASAQRRIQTMRLCRRHAWIRPLVVSGKMHLTSAAQLETAFAGAERQGRRGRARAGGGAAGLTAPVAGAALPEVGQSRGCAGAVDALPVTPGTAAVVPVGLVAEGERRRVTEARCAAADGSGSADEDGGVVAPPVGLPGAGRRRVSNARREEAVESRPAPEARGGVASAMDAAAAARWPAAGQARANEAERTAIHARGPSGTAHGAVASTAGLFGAGQCEASAAPGEVDRCASAAGTAEREAGREFAPEPAPERDERDEPDEPAVAAAPVSLADPRLQRELIEQAAGMSTREVASLIAAAAPESVRPRDTLRAVAAGRYTLKITIDKECERGLRQLKDLRSHVDPHMSWGDLVARLVREAVARHDPRVSGRGKRRRPGGADHEAPPEPAAVSATGRRNQAPESVGTNGRQRSTKAEAAPALAGRTTGGSSGARLAPAAAAPAAASAPEVDAVATAAAERGATPALAQRRASGPGQGTASAPDWVGESVRQRRASAPASRTMAPVPDGVAGGRAGGGTEPAVKPAAGAARVAAGAAAEAGAGGGTEPAVKPAAGAVRVAAGAAAEAGAGEAVRVRDCATAAPESARGVCGGGSARAARHATRGSGGPERGVRRRRAIPAAVRRLVWQRDGGRCRYRDPLTGRRCNSSHLLQIDHLLPVARGGGEEPSNLRLSCFAHHRQRHREERAAGRVPTGDDGLTGRGT